MADNKSKQGKQDRSRVMAGEGYEVNYFARKHGLSTDHARQIIEEYGPDRAKLNDAAERILGKRGEL